jgi:serine/threonine protein kinase
VTGYEIFTGQLPWERSASSEETFRRRLNTPPRDPRELKKGLDDDLAKVLLKAIAREAAERYPSANAMKAALAKVEKQDY